MKIELVLPELENRGKLQHNQEEAYEDFNGKEVFFATFCPKHQVGVLMVGPPNGEPLDVDCVLRAISDARESLARRLIEISRDIARRS